MVPTEFLLNGFAEVLNMIQRKRIFLIWFTEVIGFFILANLAGFVHDSRQQKFRSVGFPFEFALWKNGQFESVNSYAATLNFGVAIIVSTIVALTCTFARARRFRNANPE